MEDYDYDDEAHGGFEFVSNYKDLQRAEREERGMRQIAAEAGVTISDRRGEVFRDPIQRFYVYVDAAAKRMIGDGIVTSLSIGDVPLILEQISNVPNARFKNADAFVLGFAATRNGSINAKEIQKLSKNLARLAPDTRVRDVDILRYANLWMQILNKRELPRGARR